MKVRIYSEPSVAILLTEYSHNSVQQPNVKVHFTGVSRITPEGVVSDQGKLTTCDTIVCATGFGKQKP